MSLFASETQIRYTFPSSIIDYIAAMKLPVSSTPAASIASTPGSSISLPLDLLSSPWCIATNTGSTPAECESAVPLLDRRAFSATAAETVEAAEHVKDHACGRHLVGVSVTRAMKYNGGPEAFTLDDAQVLLTKKLRGLLAARAAVCPEQAWCRSVLHIWAETHSIADKLSTVLADPARIPPMLWRTTIVLCTVTPPQWLVNHIIFKNVEEYALPTLYDTTRHELALAYQRFKSRMASAGADVGAKAGAGAAASAPALAPSASGSTPVAAKASAPATCGTPGDAAGEEGSVKPRSAKSTPATTSSSKAATVSSATRTPATTPVREARKR